MVKQIVNIPEKDISLFMQIAEIMKWEVSKTDDSKKNIDEFVLTLEQTKILEERSKTPKSEFISKNDFFKFIDEL